MNIWFKTSMSRGSNTSNSRISRFDTNLPIITENRPKEANDEENDSEMGDYHYPRNLYESDSFPHQKETNELSDSAYIFKGKDDRYEKLFSSRAEKEAELGKKSVRFDLSRSRRTSNEKTYQIYEQSQNNSVASHYFMEDNSNLKFKHIRKYESIGQSELDKPNKEEEQEVTLDSVFTFQKQQSNPISSVGGPTSSSHLKKLRTSLQNNVCPTSTSKMHNYGSIRSTMSRLHTQRSHPQSHMDQNQQNWSALRSRRDVVNTKTASKLNIRQHIVSIIEYCSNEVGLAVYNTANGEIHLCQIIERLTYLRTISTIERFYPLEIVYSCSLEHTPLVKKLQAKFRNVTFKGFKRVMFDETKGYRIYSQRGNKDDYNPDNKFIAYSALNALIAYLETTLETKFNYTSLSVKWHRIQDLLIIDSQTIAELEIFLNAESKRNTNCFIEHFSCLTHGGTRMLRANMLQPLANYRAILERQELVGMLMQDRTLYEILRTEVVKFRNFQLVTAKLIQSPREKNIKSLKTYISAIYTLSHQCLLLAKFYQKIAPYVEKQLPVIGKLFSLLNDPKISQIRENIDENFDEQILKSYSANKPIKRQNFIFLFKLQKLQDEFIQILRINYSHTMEQIFKLFKQIKEKSALELRLLYNQFRGYYLKSNKRVNLSSLSEHIQHDIIQISEKKDSLVFSTSILVSLNNRLKETEKKLILQSEKVLRTIIQHIQTSIDVLFDINYEMSVIDMVLAFVGFIKKYNAVTFTKPSILQNSKTMALRGLKTIWTNESKAKISQEIALQVLPSKSVVVLQKQANSFEQLNLLLSVGYLTILTQMGCFVPAAQFTTELYQAILSKLHPSQSIESGLSHFQTELHQFRAILDNAKSGSCLILMDELVKGTMYEEEISISMALVTQLARVGGKVFVLMSDRFQLSFMQRVSQFQAYFYSDVGEEDEDQIIKQMKKRKGSEEKPGQKGCIQFELLKAEGSVEPVMNQHNFSKHFLKSFSSLIIQDQNKALPFL